MKNYPSFILISSLNVLFVNVLVLVVVAVVVSLSSQITTVEIRVIPSCHAINQPELEVNHNGYQARENTQHAG